MTLLRKTMLYLGVLILTASLTNTSETYVHAATSTKTLSKSQTISLLKNGRKAMDNVFEKSYTTPLTQKQIYDIMQPYFTPKYIENFIKCDLEPVGDKWKSTRGGAVYVYAFYYNSNFKVTYSKDKSKSYVSEKNYEEGEGGYVTQKLILIKTKAGWRIDQYDDDARYFM
ncbi:DUF3993 domain-containing protein [Aneurinibacillus uraniidurans]|uniref:DUF3993 domain-containing protein n=1 Tax=Aneurinibacillus uraniidurans TaxID=2966586 RepID=UPI00234A61AF|nr:DUF3993 domain-containing protein [Aneurinibacillus sp. B1]WCN38389.1 DUF3993 domain-containing protein [Aneurinibacillus sp. B1]